MSRLKGVTVAAALAASLVAWSGNAFAQAKVVDGPEVRWKLAAWGKPRAATQNIETLRKFMDERTGGKFKIQIGYESFGQPKELLDLLKVGSLEMTNICASYHPEKLPVFSALDLPFLPIQDTSVQEKVHMAFYNHPLVVKEFASWNAKPFLSSLLPNNEFVGRGKAPKTVDDFKGMRVRALAGIGEGSVNRVRQRNSCGVSALPRSRGSATFDGRTSNSPPSASGPDLRPRVTLTVAAGLA